MKFEALNELILLERDYVVLSEEYTQVLYLSMNYVY